MSLRINQNTTALIAARQAGNADNAMAKSLARIATGRKINSAADDASAMVIADKLKSQSLAAGQQIRNASDNISIAQTADGALGQISDILQDIRTKSLDAANGLHSADSLSAIQSDINASLDAIKDIVDTTSFNGQTLLDGTFNTDSLSIGSVDPSQLGSTETGFLSGIDITSTEGAQQAIEALDLALSQVNQVRSNVGSSQNQYTSDINTLSTTRINLMAAESQIRDTDLAEESIVLNQMKLLARTSTYAMAQANKTQEKLIDLIG